MRIVLVEWLDSCEPNPNSDVEEHELPEPQRLKNVGFEILESEEHLTIAGGTKPELKTWDYVISIPKCSIVELRELT